MAWKSSRIHHSLQWHELELLNVEDSRDRSLIPRHLHHVKDIHSLYEGNTEPQVVFQGDKDDDTLCIAVQMQIGMFLFAVGNVDFWGDGEGDARSVAGCIGLIEY